MDATEAAANHSPGPAGIAVAEPIGSPLLSPRKEEPTLDRVTVLWNAKLYILAVVVIIGATVYGLSTLVTPTYSSSATVRISATQGPGGSATDIATASNDFAAQYAAVATSSAVLLPAARSAKSPPYDLSGHISAGTVSSQNLVRVTAQSSSPAEAERWAAAVANSLASFVRAQSSAQANSIQASLRAQLAPIRKEITALQTNIDKQSNSALPGTVGYVKLQNEEDQVTELLTSQSDLLTTTAVSIAATHPQVEVFSAANVPTEVSPKPSLYALVGAAGALLVAGEVALARTRRQIGTDKR